jgi:hypothetical protein
MTKKMLGAHHGPCHHLSHVATKQRKAIAGPSLLLFLHVQNQRTREGHRMPPFPPPPFLACTKLENPEGGASQVFILLFFQV